ncbi:TetR/AcrR family transcriptional regulator [Amycolatopsis rifamycinica]|uniref:TetR family transcriptional regulator n=1 Tax=Amycolatopsis rifamycinica TaxID=287986 RepID=A0A066UDQ7_9PSEU|nr:TetR/AcrR family transcriptional regulator [Amycolatopsis rifamycinica]KDN24012.1 TetR family transcriptional regulator [Amycolatopsis rifamycinica]
MRADAARNLELLLTTGARMLAEDPATSIAAIAAEAGVDRRTVYRRFTGREELLAAVYEARLAAIEAAIEAARLREAPVPVALHRYVEEIVGVNRTWPAEVSRMRSDPEIWARRLRAVEEVDRFLERATEEGFLRTDVPARWPGHVLGSLVHLSTRDLPGLSDAQAADVIVETFLRSFGKGDAHPS